MVVAEVAEAPGDDEEVVDGLARLAPGRPAECTGRVEVDVDPRAAGLVAEPPGRRVVGVEAVEVAAPAPGDGPQAQPLQEIVGADRRVTFPDELEHAAT